MFITIEGIEGAGKTSLLPGLAEYFRASGRSVLTTREPGGSSLGRHLREYLLNPAEHPNEEAELFLFLADRAQHVAEVIRPALDRGQVVLCDRYADSTIAYQGDGRGLDHSTLIRLNALATGNLWPDRTFVLDMDVESALLRACKRDINLGTDKNEGRFEAESLAFHRRIREGFLHRAKEDPDRIRILDATESPDAVLAAAIALLP